MGFLRNAIRTGIAMKAVELGLRAASKPANQRKAKEMLGKFSNRGPSQAPR